MRNVKSSGSPKAEAKRTTANLPSPTPDSLETRYALLASAQSARDSHQLLVETRLPPLPTAGPRGLRQQRGVKPGRLSCAGSRLSLVVSNIQTPIYRVRTDSDSERWSQEGCFCWGRTQVSGVLRTCDQALSSGSVYLRVL